MVILVIGICSWILCNLLQGVVYGIGIGIGLFLLLIVVNGVGLVIKNLLDGLLVVLGNFDSFLVVMLLIGFVVIIGLEKMKVLGGILLIIIGVLIVGLIFDFNVYFFGIFVMLFLSDGQGNFLIGSLDIVGVFNLVVLLSVLVLVMMVVFDVIGIICVVVGQVNLLDKDGQIINGGKVLIIDFLSSVFFGLVGVVLVVVYIELVVGIVVGGKIGLIVVMVGVLFLLILFFFLFFYLVLVYVIVLVLMYVGLLMLSNVVKIDFNDFVDVMVGLIIVVFIVLICNIVMGIMIGFVILVIGCLVFGEWCKLNFGMVIIVVVLVVFYVGGWVI